jgi:hypothetical protein
MLLAMMGKSTRATEEASHGELVEKDGKGTEPHRKSLHRIFALSPSSVVKLGHPTTTPTQNASGGNSQAKRHVILQQYTLYCSAFLLFGSVKTLSAALSSASSDSLLPMRRLQ